MADPGNERDELRVHIRQERASASRAVAVRGGPDDAEKLRRHATRTHRAFVLDGRPIFGISVFCALDDVGPASLDGLLSGRLATYRWVHIAATSDLAGAGLELLPTFARPHFTLVLDDLTSEPLQRLVAALGPAVANPYHRGGRSGR